jgi:hypothetical protein
MEKAWLRITNYSDFEEAFWASTCLPEHKNSIYG